MKAKRNIVLLTAALFSINLLTGCGQSKVTNEAKETVTDFYDMVNKQWLEENKEYSGVYYGTLQEQEDKVAKSLDNYLSELSKKHSAQAGDLTETEEKAAILYEQATDMEKRNELGIEPIQDLLVQVEKTRDLEDLITLYKDEKISFFNPLFGFKVAKDASDGSYQVVLYPKTICGHYSMFTEEQFAGYESLVKQLMIDAGYEEERAAEIAKHAVETERKILELNFVQLDNYSIDKFSRYDEKNIVYLLSNIPVMEIAKEQGYLENRVTLTCSPEHLTLLQELFVEENTDALKDYLLAAIVVESAPYLSEEMAQTYAIAVNALMGAEEETENSYKGYEIVKLAMEDFLAEYYMEEYVGKEMEQEVADLTEEIRGEFKEKIQHADWLSEQTRNYAIKKLDAMKLYVGLPEKIHDYSKMTIYSYEEGGNLIENILNVYVNDCDFQKEFLEEECAGVYYFQSLEVNASYAPTYNVFAINAAYITLNGCNQDLEYEEKLAILGFTIAHEMSHGFDGIGSNYAVDGTYQNWWKTEDKAAYRERLNKVKRYYDKMEVNEKLTVVGENVMNEAYSDLSAMSVCMDLLKKKQNSDYKLFFESYAKRERIVSSDEFLAYLVNYDTHLTGKIRVNHIVNQMDEFYEVYQIPEDGDMYVKDEDRLHVWE